MTRKEDPRKMCRNLLVLYVTITTFDRLRFVE